ncbi:hypothetical protein [Sphingobacterium sp. LRF_L2]|uniref:hypothetical protein n=1 Tax=Sphingobacterium sp. LRF_L2 TaxID=3369421 RepID=UPI003F5EFE38
MKNKSIIAALSALLIGFVSCSKSNDDETTPPSTTESRYILQTISEIAQLKPGFMASYEAVPTGTVSNVTQSSSVSGQANEGWRTYNGQVFKMFNASFERGIYKLNVAADGKISYDTRSIKTNNTINGSGNFAIESETKGYYWDADDPWNIQTFNPTTVQRTGKLDYDFETKLKKSDAGIGFQGLGQHFLAIKKGKLYADIVYSKGTGSASGMFNDFFPNVYLAVIDLTTGAYEKTLTIENTGSIGYINDNEMYSFDSNGDLYIICQGTNGALGKNSKIVRIKADETSIDSWELKFSEFKSTDEGKFTAVFAKDQKLIVTINDVPLINGTPAQGGNINAGEIWKFYSVDVSDKKYTAIEGVPLSTNSGGAYAAFALDDKILLRISAPSASFSGFYELNGTTATKLFGVAEGYVANFAKITLQ